MDQDELAYLQQMENQLRIAEDQKVQMSQGIAATMFNSEQNDNLIKWQLDIKDELERIEHLLRKHIPKIDSKGKEYYIESSSENQLFNENGVQEILNILAWYLNKNIILSNFDEEQINLRVKQFGMFLTDFIFINYERFGLDTPEKIKHFPMVIMNLINTVEAAYNRALNGGERNSLRTARTVTQSEPIGGFFRGNSPGGNNFQKKGGFSLLKPSSWARV